MNKVPQKVNKIKEENRAGLLYAKDSDGNLVYARDAEPGKKYYCPICGCPVHLTTTRLGKAIFARYPKAIHTSNICYTMENKGTHSFRNLSPENFIAKLCMVSSRKINKGGGTDGGDLGTGGTSGPSSETEEKLEYAFTSLKQIADNGIDCLDPFDKQGEYYISDFIMTYKYAIRFFEDPEFVLGARILYARYVTNDFRNRTITFKLFGHDRDVKFVLIFNNAETFRDIRKKFVNCKEGPHGKTIYERTAYKDVLIASDSWEKVESDVCVRNCKINKYCKKCLGLYVAYLTNKKQIYLIPPEFDEIESGVDDEV